jgi:hypothetical protein
VSGRCVVEVFMTYVAGSGTSYTYQVLVARFPDILGRPYFISTIGATRLCQKYAISTYNPDQMFLLEGDRLLRLESFGEDTCELVSTIEQSFGIKFTQDELVVLPAETGLLNSI